MKRLILIFLICNSFIINAQTNVVKVEAGAVLPQNYITYFLPKTEIVVSVNVKKTIQKAGRFANYAKRFLALENIITKDHSYYEIADIALSNSFIPDSTKQYAVEINSKSVAYKLKLNEKGIIESVNFRSEKEKYIDTVLPQRIDTLLYFDYSLFNEDILNATSEAKMAELTAKQILNIRENRMELLSGDTEHNIDGNALEQMLSNLDKTEAELLALFTGKTATYTENKKIKFVPAQEIDKEVIFRFSNLLGIVDKDNFVGRPITVSVKPDFAVAADNRKNKNNGIFYNVAGNASVAVFDGNAILCQNTFIMPQFGYVMPLPANIFNNSYISVKFTDWGNIEEIK